ncbi:hypothetical protein CP532_3769, partial [Ophiocordyceps camponoti-leonardi (nom. inval.)]
SWSILITSTHYKVVCSCRFDRHCGALRSVMAICPKGRKSSPVEIQSHSFNCQLLSYVGCDILGPVKPVDCPQAKRLKGAVSRDM